MMSASNPDVVRTTMGMSTQRRVSLDALQRLATVHLRHVEVEQDQARARRRAGLAGVSPRW